MRREGHALRVWNQLDERAQAVRHVTTISRTPSLAISGITGGNTRGINGLESIILILLTVTFQGWDNFPSVIRNLEKYYSKN